MALSKFSIFYADPPWLFGSRGPRSGRFAELDYRSLTLAEICNLGPHIKNISDKDAALFLWSTSAHLLTHAPKVFDAWGFKYVRVDSVWKKTKKSGNRHGVCGPWGLGDCEYLLMGVRGQMCNKQVGKRNLYTVVENIFTGKHSRKPEVFRRRINHRFPELKKIELFSRQKVKGWTCIGDEIDGLDIVTALKEINQ